MYFINDEKVIENAAVDNITESDINSMLILDEVFETYGPDGYEEFINSELCEALVQEGKLSKRTIVRFNRDADLKRRTGMASTELSRQAKTSNYKNYIFHRQKMLEYKARMRKDFANKAKVMAMDSQRIFTKNVKSLFKKAKVGDKNA